MEGAVGSGPLKTNEKPVFTLERVFCLGRPLTAHLELVDGTLWSVGPISGGWTVSEGQVANLPGTFEVRLDRGNGAKNDPVSGV